MMALENNLYWRSELPEGWRTLYERLVADLAGSDPEAVVEQAKEKFGMLRVYLDRTDAALDVLVLEAERASTRMCQVCGEDAVLCHSADQVYRVYATFCVAHRNDSIPAIEDPVVMSLKVAPDGTMREVKRR